MSGKKIAGWTTTALLVVALVAVGITAATTGSEASKLDGMLKDDVNLKKPVSVAVGQLKDLGYELETPDASGSVKGKGRGHWAIIYGTWLTVSLDARPDQSTSGYHIDRASAWF